ncbi:Ribokinase-like protein [Glarea lozoyensis ATCC 20868]|uniref:Ribokinase n=1 Tax=Glarea lozoyensis (strain ATCC 20868 / MF5171) TaxID=1116229 RepID=S3D9Q2_GLAL2|nr:Ribokinase-like protein [Glarea lozoyensis ATCC 20868]EPE33849.1 Ribokinase-like protein [Glarea lozoyensis ATCC 20868]
MSSKTITIIGSLNVDLVTVTPRVPSGGETLTASSFSTGPGGKGANQAVACARLSRSRPTSTSPPTSNIAIKMLGAAGADEFGPPLLAGMAADGIDISSVSVVKGQTTGVAVILVEESSGENRILLNPGANHTLQPEDFTSAASLGTPTPDLIIMQLEIPIPTVLQILKTAKEAKVQVLLNPAPAVKLPEEVYPGITHLIVNETEAALLTNRSVEEVEAPDYDWSTIINEFLCKGVTNVIITLGSKGAVFAHSGMDKPGFVPAEKVAKVVDTTAAGDTFVGAYAVNVVRKGGNGVVGEEDIKLACKAAGRTVEKQGAQSAIPWADEI